ncbi:dihydrofolate reductase family protein [Nocardia sp. CDC159]|uniref:Dihydrofolate reductase family protein n=1 Tax=Nocardia pulmonis TaxID=2951408 RepID=A0A9X2E9T0_9NOCA|nr:MULTISPECIES: dihydrofolate reductase family protein [Nocardia]MCM6775488.1 dihydrofolate reductase family protein [Nocardia pulmonis]MCM6787778.1 dihydrofolate reductase family protein [Nocardia sp. CDC159]
MSTVITGASMSIDGYIAGPGESGFEHLFAWYEAGDRELPSTHPEIPLRLSEVDHRYLSEHLERLGVLVVGRRLFDMTDGWNGIHPMDRPVVVVTHRIPQQWIDDHPGAPFTFVDGIEAALEQASKLAEGRAVAVNGGTIARQFLEAGLLDEIHIDLIPVVLGGGTPFFDQVGAAPHVLENPTIVPGERVTHLRYRVRKG